MPVRGSVLEVGCGPGLMLAAFRSRGWKALGIERDEELAAAARSRGVEVTATPISELRDELRFDLIILFQALEHIGEPMPLLRECARRLLPGGRVIVNVPNFGSWQSHFGGCSWFHLDVPRHLVHYTPETLADTLRRVGLTVTAISYVSLEHDPYGWIETVINRITARPNTLTRFLMGIDAFGPATLLSLVLAALFSVPALFLSAMSWRWRKGALIELTAAHLDGALARHEDPVYRSHS